MSVFTLLGSLNRDQRNTFIASFLGWTLDAFDFFLVSFVTLRIAGEFKVALSAVVFTTALTLMLRPVGALIFGILADRFGRRIPLMVDIICYSVIELLTAFSPNYVVFLILRVLFGIAMGGEWGLGSSMAMEALPARARGLFSGILQQGYACGYLLGAIVYFLVFTIFPSAGWRLMFIIGVLPALLVVFIRTRVPESPVWMHRQETLRAQSTSAWSGMVEAIKNHWVLFIYVILLMTAFNSLSHGTQDNLPNFLQAQLKLGVASTSTITIISNIGAIIGGTLFGYYSQQWGRRRAIIIACVLGLIMIPLWVGFVRIPGVNLLVSIAIGAFLLQFMVQGAWGIIPAHLNELSPTDVRGTFPGFAYQLGNLFAAQIVFLEAVLAENFGTKGTPDFATALAIFSLGAFIAVIIFTAIGREARHVEFIASSEQEPALEGGSSSSSLGDAIS
jgi:SHS family lactate transporter-like MFS transporter